MPSNRQKSSVGWGRAVKTTRPRNLLPDLLIRTLRFSEGLQSWKILVLFCCLFRRFLCPIVKFYAKILIKIRKYRQVCEKSWDFSSYILSSIFDISISKLICIKYKFINVKLYSLCLWKKCWNGWANTCKCLIRNCDCNIRRNILKMNSNNNVHEIEIFLCINMDINYLFFIKNIFTQNTLIG